MEQRQEEKKKRKLKTKPSRKRLLPLREVLVEEHARLQVDEEGEEAQHQDRQHDHQARYEVDGLEGQVHQSHVPQGVLHEQHNDLRHVVHQDEERQDVENQLRSGGHDGRKIDTPPRGGKRRKIRETRERANTKRQEKTNVEREEQQQQAGRDRLGA